MKKFKANIPPIEVCNNPPAPEFKTKLDALTATGPLVGFAGRFVAEQAIR